MQTMADTARGLSVLVSLTLDRFLALCFLAASLLFSAWVGGH